MLIDMQEQFAHIPIGFVPLGYTNTLSKSLLPNEQLNDVASMLEASFAVVRGITRPTDVLEIQVRNQSLVDL